MARILYSTFCNVPGKNVFNGPFHEGLVKSLSKHGNKVFIMVTNDFLVNPYQSGELLLNIKTKKLNNYIKEVVKPDIIFTFNNSLYDGLLKILDCPIALWCADSPPTHSNKSLVKENIYRYHLLHFSESTIGSAKQIYGDDVKNSVIGYASDFQREELVKDYSISFIGSYFGNDNHFKYLLENSSPKEIDCIKDIVKRFEQDPIGDFDKLFNKKNHFLKNKLSHLGLMQIFSNQKRLELFFALKDMGLKIYGNRWWYEITSVFPDIFKVFDPKPIFSVKDNQDIYNKSKVCLNISHVQSDVDNMPFRVCDIMASDGVLLSDYKTIYSKLFGKDLKIPMYENQFEAREMSRKLLQDEKWRREIVFLCNKKIQEKFRFEHRLRDLEQIFGINFISKNNKEIKYKFIDAIDFVFVKKSSLLVNRSDIQNMNHNIVVSWMKLLLKYTLPKSLKKNIIELLHPKFVLYVKNIKPPSLFNKKTKTNFDNFLYKKMLSIVKRSK